MNTKPFDDKNNNANKQKMAKRYFVSAESVLRYLISNDDELEGHIICKQPDEELFTTDLALHEAFGSIKPYDEIKTTKIAKFFENVDVHSFRKFKGEEKPVLTHARVDELRTEALKKKK